MPFSHFLLTLVVVVVWGVNFLFVKLALAEMTPLLLCALRFIMASFPAILFIKIPSVPLRLIISYGLIMFALQFSLLFMGMQFGMPPGLTSIIMQVQVFFSMLFASIVFKERPNLWQILGALISFSGILLVGKHFDADISFTGFLFILAAAASWGVGNLITKNIHNANRIALVIWSSFVASIPMAVISLLFENPTEVFQHLKHLSSQSLTALIYIVYGSTWLGYGLWNWLLARHPVSVIVPFTLLIPIVGVASSVVVLNEPLEFWKIIAAFLVIGGLGINLLGTRFFSKKYIKPSLKF